MTNLILRSHAKRGVSKDGNEHYACGPSFETLAMLAPQDEGIKIRKGAPRETAVPLPGEQPGCQAVE